MKQFVPASNIQIFVMISQKRNNLLNRSMCDVSTSSRWLIPLFCIQDNSCGYFVVWCEKNIEDVNEDKNNLQHNTKEE